MKKESQDEFSVILSVDAGDITLDNTEIKQLYFIEDIFSYTMTGKIVFIDYRGIFEFGPLTGNEEITISYGEEIEIQVPFRIYRVNKIDQIQAATEDAEVVELYFAEGMFFNLNFKQYSRSWKDTKIHSIVQHLGTHYLGTKWEKFEQTQEKLDYFYIPYWNINTTLNWLCKRGTGTESGEPGFVFYNNTKGSNFVTLEYLLSSATEEPLQVGDNQYTFSDTNQILYNKILNWSISGIDMSSVRHLSGGTRFGYDSKKKKFIKEEYEYSDGINKHTLLGKKSIFPDISDSGVNFQNFNEDDSDKLETLFHNNWNKRNIMQQCVSILVRGHEDRFCGGILEIHWPSLDIDEHYSKHMHGKYLVKSVTHVFNGMNKPAYKQKLNCIKNGYGDSDVMELMEAVRRNTA